MLKLLGGLFTKAEREKKDYYDIVCPNCFGKSHPDEVVFRATHHREGDKEYALQADVLLNQYRNKFHLSPLDAIEAVIHPDSVPEENKIYSGKILVGLYDRYGQLTRKRLCPKCHNELPFPSGKVKSNIISIIGATQVGKSVYMTMLIHTLQHSTASNFDAACMPLNAEMNRRFRQQFEEPLFENGQMLGATQKEMRQEPFIFQFSFKDANLAPVTLVFFDVAGEGMVDKEYLDLYAAHIKNSSGIMFLVDPLQMKTIRDKLLFNMGDNQGEFTAKYDEPRDVVLSLFEHFISHETNSKTDIPTAIILTKSDMLQYLKDEDGEYISPNSNVFHNFVHKKYLNTTEFENMNGEVRRFIEKVDRPFKDAIDVHFTNTAYFAVSALGSNPINRKISGVVNPIRVDEPFLWLLHRLDYIEGREDV